MFITSNNDNLVYSQVQWITKNGRKEYEEKSQEVSQKSEVWTLSKKSD